MEKSGVFEGAIVSLSSSGLVQPSISLEKSENPGDDILDDLDSYLEDINDRLTISRMVSDSVIKGMVDAISEEAAEKIGMKELEIASLKERLRIYETEIRRTAEVSKSNFSDAKLWERKSQSRGSQTVNQDANINELTSLRQDLDAILTLLSSSETGQLFPHASREGSEERNSTKKDHFHRKALSSHTLPIDSFTERNGKHDKSESTEPDNMESVQLKHMSKEELINYYKGEMTKMKRNHESQVHDITEKYFSLRRDILKENGPSLLRKDKNFEALRTKIPEVITKLDDILMENEKLHVANDNIENLSCLKDKLDTLVSENFQLKDSLSSSRKEINSLLSQVSDASNNMSNHSVAEANLLNQIMNLKSEIEDMKIEFSVKEEVYECFLKDFLGKSKWDIEDSEMESIGMHEICEIVFREAAIDAKATPTSGIEDSNMEYLITEELIGIIFKEAFKDAKTTIEHLTIRYENEKERRASLHASLLESEKVLSLELEEKSKLKEEILSFAGIAAMLEEKEKLAREAHSTLMKEREHSDLIYRETNRLEQQVSQQESLITEIRMESSLMKSNLEEALKQIHLYEDQMKELVQNLELAREDLENTNMQKNTLLNNIEEKQSIISSVGAKEIEHRRQLSSIIMTVQILSKAVLDFECRAMEKVKMNNLRLERLNTLCYALGRKANLLRKAELVYKQKLDRRSSDLQKAEAEVDLLGDEVDVLLSLLEKIYVALDHYSPILQHYPGIMEILKLVRRELSGETTKTV